MNSLIEDYCPSSGSYFAADRCNFYARLAYNKTSAQDGWQTARGPSVMVCFNQATEFSGCSYDLWGNSYYSGMGEDDYSSTGRISPFDGSPIERWQYAVNESKILAINLASRNYVLCTDDTFDSWQGSVYWQNLQPTLSPWPLNSFSDAIPTTQYGTLVVWIINDDTVEDVYRDVLAEHEGSNFCNAKFQLDLKDVRAKASF